MSQDPTTTPTPPDDPTEPPALKRHVLEMHVPDPSRANDAFVAWTAGLGGVLAVAFALVLRLGGPLPVYSGCLALSLFLLGLAVRRYFFDRFPEVVAAEPREVVEEVRVPVTAAVDPRDDEDDDYALIKPLERRGFLTRIIVGAFGALGISLLSLVPSLGPNVGNTLRQTPWARGVRAVNNDGEPLRPEDLATASVSDCHLIPQRGGGVLGLYVLALYDPAPYGISTRHPAAPPRPVLGRSTWQPRRPRDSSSEDRNALSRGPAAALARPRDDSRKRDH